MCGGGTGGGGEIPVEMECDFLIMLQHVASEVVASSVFGAGAARLDIWFYGSLAQTDSLAHTLAKLLLEKF